MGTHYPNPAEIQREWLLVDLNGLTLGRAATQIAHLLRGKHKATFTPHYDVGDFVVVINADKVKLSGRKLDNKMYYRHSGYMGSTKSRTARQMLATKPEEIIKLAVKRMLPRGPLGRATYRKLKVYAGDQHPHDAQQPKPHSLSFA